MGPGPHRHREYTGKPQVPSTSSGQALRLRLSQLHNIPGIGPDKADRYGAAIIALCRGEHSNHSNTPDPPSISSSRPKRLKASRSGETPVFRTNSHQPVTRSNTAAPVRSNLNDENPLTPAQQALDQRLRHWRSSEAERLGLPQFFVLGSSTLRNIVLAQPHTLSQLKTIDGLNHEKLEKFGAGILEACNA